MQRALFLYPAAIGLGLVTACATRPPAPPDGLQIEPFVIERDLSGATVGRGMFSAVFGPDRGFTAYLNGDWNGKTLTLVEDFEFDDGEKDRKTWRLTRTAEGRFRGTREDVIGEAQGFVDGRAFRLEYTIELDGEDGKRGRRVKFRDILYKRADGVILNTATVGYYGLRVGRVELEIMRASAD